MKTERVHFWQGFSVALALVLAAVAADSRHSIAAQSGRQRFSEIDVERINVVEADGTVKLVIANRERSPDQVTDGQSRPRTAANKSPGITFFDDAGDEAGGLKIRGLVVTAQGNARMEFVDERGSVVSTWPERR